MTADMRLIRQLEKQLGKKLDRLDEIDLDSGIKGYVIDEAGNVSGLGLYSTNLTDLSPLQGLTKLTNLDLGSNNLTDLSPLQGLTNLTNLDLGSTNLTDLSPLQGLTNLTRLDLRKNRIKKLPPELLELGMEVLWKDEWVEKGLNLYDNPLESPPVEVVRQGLEAIREYFRASGKEETRLLNEVKVLLVGEGGAGKTSLVRRLVDGDFRPGEKQTHGVYIRDWPVKIGSKDVKVHFWDFGGQGIMQAAHQLFFSVRSLYVLVMNARQEPDPEDWFKRVESFGGDSPIMVVINKVDENRYNLNEKDLQRRYPAIKGFYHVSCKKPTGITDFKKALKKQISGVKMISTELPLSWFKVKKKLEELRKDEPYITVGKYEEICEGAHVTETRSRKTLIDYLHILGVALHYDDYELLNTQVLNPEWVTKAIYKIINSRRLKKQHGIVPKSSLNYILNREVLPDFDGKAEKYSTEEERYIVQLMKKFELCFELDGGDRAGRILVPDLLEAEEPDYDFPKNDVLSFYFEYDFLPSSILPSFMVKRQLDVDIDLCWRTGMVISDKNFDARALVRLDKNKRRIHIQVAGAQKRDYFSTIRKTILDINAGFRILPVRQWVPLPDEDEYAVEFDELLGHERVKPRRDKIFIGKLRKEYPVSMLLDGIETPEERKDRARGEGGVKIGKIDIHGTASIADVIEKIENRG